MPTTYLKAECRWRQGNTSVIPGEGAWVWAFQVDWTASEGENPGVPEVMDRFQERLMSAFVSGTGSPSFHNIALYEIIVTNLANSSQANDYQVYVNTGSSPVGRFQSWKLATVVQRIGPLRNDRTMRGRTYLPPTLTEGGPFGIIFVETRQDIVEWMQRFDVMDGAGTPFETFEAVAVIYSRKNSTPSAPSVARIQDYVVNATLGTQRRRNESRRVA